MINQELKSALLAKLNVQAAALSKRAQKKKLEVPMSTEDATYLIAHEEGIRIDRYLTPEQVARIRGLHTTGRALPSAGHTERRASRAQATHARELRFPSQFRVANPLLQGSKLHEAVAMAGIYPVLYVLENSMRELIKRVMESTYGENWWNTELNKGRLKNLHEKAEGRMQSEKRNSWHQKRGAHPIDYVDIADLEVIIQAKRDCFIPGIIPDLPWFEQFMRELCPSRHVVCHMNPLNDEHVQDVRLKLRKWENMIRSAGAAIPA